MKRVIIGCVMVLLCVAGYAQVNLRGRVSEQDGQALAGASVYLPEQKKGTICDEEGVYHLENLPEGKHKIQISFIGFNTAVKTFSLKKGNNELNISLSQAVIESQEIVVSGISVSSQHENAVKIDVLKGKDIAFSGTPNFMESLTKVPGVDMISRGQGVSKPVIRGLAMNDILVLNNGVRIENYQFSENHPLGIDDNGIEQVEIIKGPASLLYGSDAIGGILNFIREKPAATGTLSGDFQTRLYSNSRGLSNSLSVKGASAHFFGGIRANRKTHADYIQGGGGFVPNSRFNQWSLSANSGYTGKSGTFILRYDYFDQDLGMTVGAVQSLVTERGRKNTVWYQDLGHHLISSQNTIFLGRSKWETNMAFQSALRKLQKTLPVPSVEMNLNTLTYDSKLSFPGGEKTEYTAGIQGMRQTNRNHHERESQFLPDANINNIGMTALLQYQFTTEMKLQGGFRYDFSKTETFEMGTAGTEGYHAPFSNNYSSLSGSLGATCLFDETLILRLNFAKAFRVPNLSELTSYGEHGNRFEFGNENLDPENAWESDAGIHFHGTYFSFDLAGFYNYIDHYIFISPTDEITSSGMRIYRFSQTNSKLYGGEAGIHFHPESMPWLHIEGTYSQVTGKQANGDYLPFIPAHKFRYEIKAEKEKLGCFSHPSIRLSALSAFRQNRPSPHETETEGYTLVNACIKMTLPIRKQPFDISFMTTNFFDKKYIDRLSTLKPLQYFNPGRNISLTVS
ncbi:MAG: TonB-dependent receptor, partial [Mangrovibacterium sp.]|nr:TonB-dependent receptor [Mangrovibacterium sp.]